MPNEPMVTIKDEQGNLKQVPLSQLSKQTGEHTLPTPALDTQKDVAASDVPTAVVPEDVEDLARMAQEQIAAEDTVEESKEATDDVKIDEGTREVAQETPAPQPEQDDVAAGEADIPQNATEAPQALAVSSSQLPSMTTPNIHMFEHADDHAWDADDHGSLLDESLTNEDLVMPHEKNAAPALAVTEKKEPAAPRMPFPLPQTPPPAGPDLFAHTKSVPMKDIVEAPTSQVSAASGAALMGPIAELSSMTLDDFRRLGGRNEVGIEDLRHKFTVLLDESILLYMQGVAAWQRSPLYGQYKEVLATSVSSGQPISAVLSAQNNLTQEEFDALVSLQIDVRL